MKLTTRLVLALLAGVLLLLGLDGYLAVRREVTIFESDMERDAQTIGLAVQGMIEHLLDTGQGDQVARLIEEVNDHGPKMRLRWVPLDPSRGPSGLPGSMTDPDRYAPDIRSLWVRQDERALHTYVPATGGSGKLLGVLEIIEPRSDLDRYVRATVMRRLVLVSVLLLVSAGVVVWLGVTMVGRPLQTLIEGTRRIGAGDLATEVHVSGHDEFRELAAAMNTMAERLQESRDQLEVETSRRIAAIEELRHADRLRTVGRLASGIAHELGTPLNVVSGRATMIREGALSAEETEESARIIREQAERMTRIVRQLLDFARRPRTEHGPVDLRRYAAGVCQLLEPLGAKKGVALVFEEPGDIPQVIADPAQIEQVMSNLVVNAVQASNPGGRVELAIGSRQDSPPPGHEGPPAVYVYIRVRDDGPGIPEENLLRLFEPFFTTKEVGEGTGLGLSVVYSIVQDHRGWITARNRPEGGAEFTVLLPRAGDDV